MSEQPCNSPDPVEAQRHVVENWLTQFVPQGYLLTEQGKSLVEKFTSEGLLQARPPRRPIEALDFLGEEPKE